MKRTHMPLAIALALTVICLAPFLNKPVHLDDTMQVMIARHIVQHPLDYYGLPINWYGHLEPVYAIHTHPPLVPFYLALTGIVLGFSEIALHAGYLPVAMAFIAGTYILAGRLCRNPLLAALAALATPVTMVSSTNLIMDLHLSTFFTLALALWVVGIEDDRRGVLAASGVFMGLALLCKYFGATTVPLAIVYALMRKKRMASWVLVLTIPVLMFGAEQIINYEIYGRSTMTNAVGLVKSAHHGMGAPLIQRLANGISFAGGCFVPAALFWTLGRTGRGLAKVVLSGLALAVVIALLGVPRVWTTFGGENLPAMSVLQCIVFILAGVFIGGLILEEIRADRSPVTVLLALWLLGTFVYAAALNWSVTARAFLPAVPAVSILAVRNLERRAPAGWTGWKRIVYAPVLLSGILAFYIGWADYQWAASAKSAAEKFVAQRSAIKGELYFQGHWGWQYYMEQAGIKPFDSEDTKLKPGDCVVIPLNGSNLIEIPELMVRSRKNFATPTSRFIAIMNTRLGAGFYSDAWGPLPFVFGPVPPDIYQVVQIGGVQSAN